MVFSAKKEFVDIVKRTLEFGAQGEISPKDTETPVESPIPVPPYSSEGSSSPVRSTTPDYLFDESIFVELDNLLWIISRPLGSKPIPPKRTSTSATPAMTKATIRQLITEGVAVALEAQDAPMENIPPKRTSTSATPAMTEATIRQLITEGVAVALEAQDAPMENYGNAKRLSFTCKWLSLESKWLNAYCKWVCNLQMLATKQIQMANGYATCKCLQQIKSKLKMGMQVANACSKANESCKCLQQRKSKLQMQVENSKANLSAKKCKLQNDDDLSSEYYKELLYRMFQKQKRSKKHMDYEQVVVVLAMDKSMLEEELRVAKLKQQLYDRFRMQANGYAICKWVSNLQMLASKWVSNLQMGKQMLVANASAKQMQVQVQSKCKLQMGDALAFDLDALAIDPDALAFDSDG
nr:hypothetical protein [Tanacetum cinerariifolium]